jgi:hypothetical protein
MEGAMPDPHESHLYAVQDDWVAVAGPGYVVVTNQHPSAQVEWATGATAPAFDRAHPILKRTTGPHATIGFTVANGVQFWVRGDAPVDGTPLTVAITAADPLT